MISANGGLPAHRYTPQVTPRWPRGSEPASSVWVCVFGLGFRLRPATPGWGVGLCVCFACIQPLLATGARCGCVCLGSVFGCAPPLLAGVLGCVCAPLAPSHSWPRVRGVGVCVWARVLAAPRHSWLGCWAVCVLRLQAATPGHGCVVWVCVFGLGFWLRPATPGWGVGLCVCSACKQPLLATGARCECVCLGSGFGCAPPLLAGVLGCVPAPLAPRHSWPRVRGMGVCVWARVLAGPRNSWLGCWAVCVLRLQAATPGHGCAVWVCVFGLGFRLCPATPGWGVGLCACSACSQPLLPRVRGVGVCVWAWVSAAPRHSWLGCWAVCVLRLHPATPGHGCAVWVCVFGLGFWLRPATPGWGVGLCVCSACTQPLLAVCVLGCCAVRSLSSSLCAVLCFVVLVRLRCAVRVVRAVAGARCCGALPCVVLFPLVCSGAVLGLVARGCLLVPCCGALLSVLLCWWCWFVSFPCVCGAVLRCASCCSVPDASALLLVPRAAACPCVLWCLPGRSAVWWCRSGVLWCLAVLCVVLWCPASKVAPTMICHAPPWT